MLVPGRECGSCSACCEHLPIKTAEISKPAGVRCPHCGPSGGCAIYERRPPVCRVWLCGWRLLPGLGEEWRPDIRGILLRPWRSETYGDSVIVMVIGGLEDLLAEPVAEYLAGCVVRREPVLLEVPGSSHYIPEREVLNNYLAEPVAAGDLDAARHALIAVYIRLVMRGKEPDGLTLQVPE